MQEGDQFGQYQLIKRIASGGMAEIHLARTHGIGGFEKFLALKVIHPKYSDDQEFIDMLIDEAKIAVQLSHVNVCQIFDLGRQARTYYIAMEFIDGKDLYQLLVKCSEEGIDIPFDIITFIAMEVAAGLQYAHTKSDNYGRALNLIHRDISPQNVLLSFDGEVKIVDFGIAKASHRSRETESGVIKGKFFYMSPEQAWGDPIDARTDIFSLGICIYEMITGEMLYHEDKALQLLEKVRNAEIPNMRARRRDVPDELAQITLRALARERETRYQTAGELQGSLAAFLYKSWPGFNRQRVSAFMREVFGDQRFVMPLPPEEPRRTEGSGAFMVADEFEPSEHSVIFDMDADEALNAAPEQRSMHRPLDRRHASSPQRLTSPMPADSLDSLSSMSDDGDPTMAIDFVAPDASSDAFSAQSFPAQAPPARTAPSQAAPARQPQFPTQPDDDDSEHTIAEPVWGTPPSAPQPQATPSVGISRAAEEDDDPTAVIDMEAVRQATGAGGSLEDPTGLFSRPSQQDPNPSRRPPPPAGARRAPQSAPARPAPPPPMDPRSMDPRSMDPAPTPAETPRSAAPRPPAPPPPKPAPPEAFRPLTPPNPQKAPKKPNKAAEGARPTVSIDRARLPRRKKGWAQKLLTPGGVTVIAVVALGLYTLVTLASAIFAEEGPRTAVVIVDSDPRGARVYFDGKDTGQVTPARLETVPTGANYPVRLALPGFEDLKETVAVGAGITEVRTPTLTLVRSKGRIEIRSTPSGAEVFINGKYVGDTPVNAPEIDRTQPAATVLVRKDGFFEKREKVRWADRTSVRLDLELEPLKR